jgi:Co/Zn/Cd efflux system component
MSDECCPPEPGADPGFRRVLWIALAVNLLMFGVELASGLGAHSTALLADAADFFGDAANYAISLLVLPLGLAWRARAALIKACSMGIYGLAVMGYTVYAIWADTLPHAATMGIVGALAFVANVGVAVLLYRYRTGDSNMRSVWLCTRNDAIGNLAVMLAALGVFGTASGWPDFVVAAIMASLALHASVSVFRQARAELRGEPAPAPLDAHRH